MTAEAPPAPPPSPVPPVLDELEPGVLPFTSRLRRAAMVPLRILGALLFPDRVAVVATRERRWAGALLATTCAAFLASYVVGQRIDMTLAVLSAPPQAMGGDNGGSGATMAPDPQSDHQLDEQMVKDKKVFQVTTGLMAAVVWPFLTLLWGVALYLVALFVRGKPNIMGTLSAAALSQLPNGVQSVLYGVAAWGHASLSPGEAAKLAAPGAFTVGIVHLNWFGLWGLIILGFTFAEGGGMSRVRSFVTVIVLYAMAMALTGAIGGHS